MKKINDLSVSELIELLSNNKENKIITLDDVNEYLEFRINNKKYCDAKEVYALKKVVFDFTEKFRNTGDNVLLGKVLKNINSLISISVIEKNMQLKKIKKDINSEDSNEFILVLLRELLGLFEKYNVSCERVINKIKTIDKNININISYSVFSLLKRTLDWVDKYEGFLFRNKDIPKRKLLKKNVNSLKQKLEKFEDKDLNMRRALENGDIVLMNDDIDSKNISFSDEKLDFVNERVITIDTISALSLEGAFSIRKDRGYYIFDVYITDVPTFLKGNRNIAKRAYDKGTSISIENANKTRNTHIDILPAFLDDHYLSLRLNKLRNVIDFSFIINDDGVIESVYVTRKRLRVTDRLNYDKAYELFFSKEANSKARYDLLIYKEMVEKVIEASSDLYIKSMNSNKISDLVAFSSVLVNYYVGQEADFAIYRDGCYTKKKTDSSYTHSVTPLRRFVSNLNLAFLLNQKGEVAFNEKDLNYVEENIDEIIEHLNRQDELSKFADKYPKIVKRYIKRM